MNLEDFKEIHEGDSAAERLRLLFNAMDRQGDNIALMRMNEGGDINAYFRKEIDELDDRIEWLYEGLMEDMKRLDAMPPATTESDDGEAFRYRPPEQPQNFMELWSTKHSGYMSVSDIHHAIGNSDQFPFPIFARDYKHMAEQDAQEKTICAVIAALDRVPVYEDHADPNMISKDALFYHIQRRANRYGDSYTADHFLRDIAGFEIRRKRKG